MNDNAPKRVDRGVKRDPAFDLAIGARIRTARVSAGVALSELAERIGVSYQQVHKFELGRDRVPASTLGAIAAALNVDLWSFYSGDASALSGTASELRAARQLGERIERLSDPDVVRRLMTLVDALIDEQDGGALDDTDP